MRRLLCLVVITCFGCSDDGFRVVPVTGQVTLNGQPLAEASVIFTPLPNEKSPDVGSSSLGTTDASGKFTLRLVDPDKPGAVIGKHRVVIKLIKEEAAANASDAGPGSKTKFTIPQRYRDGSGLEFEVKDLDQNEANFALTSP